MIERERDDRRWGPHRCSLCPEELGELNDQGKQYGPCRAETVDAASPGKRKSL